jgi:Homeodomain-like domain
MRKKQFLVQLTTTEREHLRELIGSGTAPARTLTPARILLKADVGPAGPAWSDDVIAAALEVSRPTVERVRKRCATQGLEVALHRKAPDREYGTKLDGDQEAHLVALACSTPPCGRDRWTLRLLADRMVALEYVDTLSSETVRRTLKKTRTANLTGV